MTEKQQISLIITGFAVVLVGTIFVSIIKNVPEPILDVPNLGVATSTGIAFENNLKDKNKEAKVKIKTEEIVKYNHKEKFTKDEIEIEIISLTEIEGGIEIFARAWKNNKPLGFGADGSVEIERFLIYNPPILVEDPTGDIDRNYDFFDVTINATTTHSRTLKLDPVEAVRQSLTHTIGLIGKEGTDVKKGKVGKTTSTFYPAAGTNSPVDGNTQSEVGSWNTAHDTAPGAWGIDSNATQQCGSQNNNGSPTDYAIYRCMFLFDTSSIGATDVISSATFSLRNQSVNNEDPDGDNFFSTVQTQGQNITGDAQVEAADSDKIGDAVDDPTEGNDTGDRINLGSISITVYNDYTLNSTGMGWIARSGEASPVGATNGITYLGIREGHDILDNPVGTTDLSRSNTYFADQTGTTDDPKLVVEHASPSTCEYGGSGDWEVLYSDNCYITTDTYVVGDFKLINDGAGSFGLAAEIGADDLNQATGTLINMLNDTAKFNIY